MEDNKSDIENNNKILNCIINICESHPPKYNLLDTTKFSFNMKDYFLNPIKKHFSIDEINTYKNQEQKIHSYDAFNNNNLFYQSLLNDFKLYMHKILIRKKSLVLLYPDNNYNFYEIIFDNNISFIYFYNFSLFLKEISNKFPEIIKEDIYKIDMILINSIFSPDYKVSFENGVRDKFGINYENYTILMLELYDLIKEKKYEGYNDIIDIEKYTFKLPQNWEVNIEKVELEIINFLLFEKYIKKKEEINSRLQIYLLDINEEVKDNSKYISQLKKIYEKFKNNPCLDIDKLNKCVNSIITNISKYKSIEDKKKAIKEIINNKSNNKDYKLLNDYDILCNLEILDKLYSLDKNEFIFQLIYSFDLMDSFENIKIKAVFEPSSFLNFINKRKKIIQELKNATNYINVFQDILSRESFRIKVKKILSSPVIKNYYKNPKYYNGKQIGFSEFIGKKRFSEIYEDFLQNYIDNDKIYERIIIKRMPYGIKRRLTPYLNLILVPYGVDMNNNIKDKNAYIEAYLIIIFLHETNHFSKRSYYMNQPLSICKTPLNSEGGDSIIKSIFGETEISIINSDLCNKINNMSNWYLKEESEIKNFKKSLKDIIRSYGTDEKSEEQLIKIKNEQQCLVSFFNYRDPNKNESKISYSTSNGGWFCFYH